MRKKWLTPREAAELIGVTDVSIRGWANAGLITYRILGKSMSVLKEDVLRVGKEKGRIFEATLSVDDYVAMLRKK